LQDRLESLHDGGGLLGVSAGAHSEIAVRIGHSELLKKNIRHGGVVVLAGVNEGLTHFGVRTQGAQNGRGFHEVWARADNVEDVHGLGQTRL
jgi:hypothetical protein